MKINNVIRTLCEKLQRMYLAKVVTFSHISYNNTIALHICDKYHQDIFHPLIWAASSISLNGGSQMIDISTLLLMVTP